MKKSIPIILGIIVILAISALAEIFIFNSEYMSLPESQKGERILEMSEIELRDMKSTDDGIVISGEDPSFSIAGFSGLAYIKITPAEKSGPFKVIVKNIVTPVIEPRAYDFTEGFKESMYLRVNQDAGEVYFDIESADQNTKASIGSIYIVNELVFNTMRWSLISAILLIFFYLLFFRDFAARNLHVTFLLISLSLGTIISLSTPYAFSFDEKEHFIKAYQLASFDFDSEDEKEIPFIEDIDSFLLANGHTSPYDSYLERRDYFDRYSITEYPVSRYIHSTAANYLPVAHIPSAIGIFIGKALELSFITVFYLGRFFNLLVYSVVVFLSIMYAKAGKRLLFAISLFPGLVYLYGAYTADSVTMAFSLAAVTAFINMKASDDKTLGFSLPLMFAALASISVMGKMTYAPICLLILAVPKDKFKKPGLHIPIKLLTLAIVGLVALFTINFTIDHGMSQWSIPGVSSREQAKFILGNMPRYALIALNYVSKSYYYYFQGPIGFLAYSGSLPDYIILIEYAFLFILSVIDSEPEALSFRVIDRVVFGSVVVMSWALVVTSIYLTFNPVGSITIEGIHGRYFAPLLVPLFLILRSDRISTSISDGGMNLAVSASGFILLVLGAVKVLMLYVS
ncbi:MAG: DUF2142 domain-containing protein [Youngiibacter sp.]|nr:DUF2142 domain-containing protein [Youngiibacter sp.]